jgi:hypothetical protein
MNAHGAEDICPNGLTPDNNVIWCDSFEDEEYGVNNSLSDNYYEFDDNAGDHIRQSGNSIHGAYSLRARWQQGEVNAGHLMRNFGENPIGSQSHTTEKITELYWRMYVKYENGFIGHPDKLSRAISFANSNWAQAMIAHVWSEGSDRSVLAIDPVSGIDESGQLATTKWNDWDGFTWLGLSKGETVFEPGKWYCVEAHVKLNTPGSKNGVFELWIDEKLDAQLGNLDWVKDWTTYGINSLMISHYWNEGSPAEQERYIDALVISKKPIGCLGSQRVTIPNPPILETVN